METFNIDNFDQRYFNRNLVIDASAGTGKTYSITKMVKKLVENGIDVKKILIVTYTEKATGELRDRIRKELNDVVKDKNDLDNLNIYTIHSFSQNAIKEFGLKANQPLNLDVIDEPTQVGDFFDRYVREKNKRLSNDIDKILLSDATIRVVDPEEKADDLKKYFVGTLLKYYLSEDGEIDESIISIKKEEAQPLFEHFLSDDAFESFYNNFEGFKENYDCLANSKDVILLYVVSELKNALQSRNTGLKKRISFEVTKGWPKFENERNAIDYFFTLKNNKISISSVSTQQEYIKHYDVLSKSCDTKCVIFAELLRKENDAKKFFDVKNKNNWPANEYRASLDYFLKFIDNVQKCSFERILLDKFIDDFYMKWQEEKRNNKNQTFNDMLRTIRETLLNEEDPYPLKSALQDKYCYAIIDEFQDTNQLQFDTFKKIFMEDDKHHIIVVGDPKQSIYSFQGADLNVYQKAKKEILDNGGLSLTLKTNYRSSKAMIDECNKYFKCDFFQNDQIGNDMDSIAFVESDSPNDNLKVAKYLGQETAPYWMGMEGNDVISEKIYAKLAVKTIIDCCTKDEFGNTNLRLEGRKEPNVTFKDFTVLARTRSEMPYIERELKKCGVPYIKYKDTGLFYSNECAHWVAILEAINTSDFTGSRRKKLKKALFTDFFDRSLEEINSDHFNHDDCDEVRLINKWKSLVKEGKWEDLFDDIIFESHLLLKLKELNKLQSLTIYKQISNYCVSYLYDNHSLDDLIYKLKNSSKATDDEEDSGTVEIGTDFDAVKLMTIHASKGLQYPVVISIAGFKGPYDRAVVYSAHDSNDEYKRKICFSHDEAENDEMQEWKRLLYVCFTRAEYINIMPYYKNGNNAYSEILHKTNEKYIKNNNSKYLKLNFNDTDFSYYSLKNQVRMIISSNEHDATDDKSIDSERATLIKKEGGLKSYKNSYSSLSHPKTVIDDEDEVLDEERDKEDSISDEFDLSEFDMNSKQIDTNLDSTAMHVDYEGFPRGATIGTALHEVFENIDFTNPNSILLDVIAERLKANRIKVTNGIKDYITTMVDNVLHATLPEIKGDTVKSTFTLSEISNDNKKPEIEFNFNLKNGRLRNYCNGFIDLLFKRGECYSILDWKSDTLNDDFNSYNDKESLRDHTNKHYSIQRVLYSYCLIHWLKEKYSDEKLDDIFKNHFGGIYYVYIRGCNKGTGNGIYAQTWNSYKELEEAFNNIIKQKVRG